MLYDYIIVGAGLYGSVFAREMTNIGKKCLILESREHIGGNCYSRKMHNINVHMYGPHYFHTRHKNIWDYVNQFATFSRSNLVVKANYRNQIYSLPFNLMTMHQLWGTITPSECIEILKSQLIHFDNPENMEEWCLSNMGYDLYNHFVFGYTVKQWGVSPKNLPSSIIKRIPLRFVYNDNYFDDEYQGVPIDGYTVMFERMLDGIDLKLNTSFEKSDFLLGKKVVYTGPIDSLFDYQFGELQYRSLKFEHKHLQQESFQGTPIMNYTDCNVKHTRITEHKFFDNTKSNSTVITYEYPDDWNKNKIPYYPINDTKNTSIYKKYEECAKKTPNLIVGGRLGDYKYYNMDMTIMAALQKVKQEQKL